MARQQPSLKKKGKKFPPKNSRFNHLQLRLQIKNKNMKNNVQYQFVHKCINKEREQTHPKKGTNYLYKFRKDPICTRKKIK